MILASHQPYFFPYIGYFSLISSVDLFVFADNRQYTRKGWMSRNRILKPQRKEAQYFHIGLQKPAYKAMLSDCYLTESELWKSKILDQIIHYKRIAPFYDETLALIKNTFSKQYSTLPQFNIESTRIIMKTLNINTSIDIGSSIESKTRKAEEPGLLGLRNCEALGASTYINAQGGESFYPIKPYSEAGVKIGFIQTKISQYNQFNDSFIPRLSIIDVLMFNGIKKTSEMVKEYDIKWMN